VPEADEEVFAFIDYQPRRVYHAMVAHMDSKIGEMVSLLRHQGMYDTTLIAFSADNGGPIEQAANNYPLRGGKHTNWEGGIRVNAFLSGGYLPATQRGTVSTSLMALWDWYATLASAAGLPADALIDHRAAAAGLPPIDSVDQWPHLSGQVAAPPRLELPLGSCAAAGASTNADIFCQGSAPGPTVVEGLIAHINGTTWKLLLGRITRNCTTTSVFPEADQRPPCPTGDCGEDGCLFNLDADETESVDLRPAAASGASGGGGGDLTPGVDLGEVLEELRRWTSPERARPP